MGAFRASEKGPQDAGILQEGLRDGKLPNSTRPDRFGCASGIREFADTLLVLV